MQEEVNQKTISLSIQCFRMTASVLKVAMRKYLEQVERSKNRKDQVKGC